MLHESSFEMFTSFEMLLPPDDVRDKSGFCVFLSDCSGREGGREGGWTEERRQGERRERGREERRGGGLGSRPKKMYGERLGDGVEYHLMKPTPRR